MFILRWSHSGFVHAQLFKPIIEGATESIEDFYSSGLTGSG